MISFTIGEYGRLPIGPGGPTQAQAKALLAAARAHPLANRAEASNILYERNGRLHASHMVGVIGARDCSIEILPKIDPQQPDTATETVRSRLVEMLDVAWNLKLGAGEAARISRNAPSLLDVLIQIFAEQLLTQVRRGLPRSYLQCEGDLPTLRGRLDVRRQFTVHAARADKLACRFDVLSHDTPLLQLMKACVLRLTAYARRASTRRLLDELRILLADVTEVSPRRVTGKISIDRTTGGWRSLVLLARQLFSRDWQDTRSSREAPEGVSLLFPMNKLFEDYVTALARRALSSLGIEVAAQAGGICCLADWPSPDSAAGRLFATKPDIMLRRNGRNLAIVDTKWKPISRNITDRERGIAQSDVYQMMAYAQLYRVERLMLLYPHHSILGESGPVARHRIAIAGGARLDVATVDVSASGQDCLYSLRQLLAPLAEAFDLSRQLQRAAV